MKKIDPLSQRTLLVQMRATIDLILHDERPRVVAFALRRLESLVWENPHATYSTYVQHNLGKARREALATVVRGVPVPSASPLHSTRSSSQKFLAELTRLSEDLPGGYH